jgi:gliding motility-associated-like protein
MKYLLVFISSCLIFNCSVYSQSSCPVITTITNSSSVCKGNNFTLSVTATSPNNSSLSFEWFKNGVLIGNSRQYTISGFTQDDEATYTVRISNDCGTSTRSSNIQLSLSDVPSITPLIDLVLCEGASQTITPNISSNNGGSINYTWAKNSEIISSETKNSISFSPVNSNDVGTYAIAASNICGVSSSIFNINIKEIPIIDVQPLSTLAVCSNNILQLDVNAYTNGTDIISYQWYKDAHLISGATSSQFVKNNATISDAGSYLVVIQNSCGFKVTSSSSIVTVGEVPTITVQPVSNSLCIGSNSTIFGVTAVSNGGGTLNYQWFNAGIPINGATSSIYSISGIKSSDASNSYSVQVANTCGLSSNTSSNVSLNVKEAPSISIAADKTAYCIGTAGNITFTANAYGDGLSYVWYKGQTVIGSNSSTLQENYTNTTIDGIYSVKATNSCGNATSNTIQIQGGNAPIITSNLVDQTVCIGSPVVLNVVADTKYGGDLNYTWSGPGIILNQNSSRFTISSFINTVIGAYSVTVSNSCGTAISRTINLSGQESLSINSQPQSAIVCNGSSKTLSVGLNVNSSELLYRWTLNGSNILNSDNSNLIINNISANTIGNYQVNISSACGSITSNIAEISIYDLPIFSVSPTINKTNCLSASLSLNGEIKGANNGNLPAYDFVWNHGSVILSGNRITTSGNTTSFTIDNLSNTDKGTYQIAVTDACGNTQLSNVANVIIENTPTFTTNPSSINLCVSQNAVLQSSLQINNNSSIPVSYQWELNGTPIGLANNSTYNIVSMSNALAGIYHVKATNDCGTTVSDDAIVRNVSLPKLVSVTPDTALCYSSSQTAILTVNAYTTNGSNPSIEWSTDYGSIQGTNLGNSIDIAATSKSSKYTITISNTCGIYTDKQGNLPSVTVYSELSTPFVTDFTKAPSTTFCEFANVTLGFKTLTTAPLFEKYTWILNNKTVQNPVTKNSANYIINSVNLTDAGSYIVDITNSCGTERSAVTIPIFVNPTPAVNFQASSIIQCLSNNIFTFTNTSSNSSDPNIQYKWDFGDGITDNSRSIISHSYLEGGEKGVKLTANSDNGCFNSIVQKIVVQSEPFITQQPKGGTICGEDRIVLTALIDNSFSDYVTYQWFNGSNPISGANSGTYTINNMRASDAGNYSLHVNNNLCNYQIQSEIAIVNYRETPQANFTGDANSNPACLNSDATFNFINATPDLTNSTTTYIWTYSDGTIDKNINSTHQFKKVGKFSVSLQAISGGCNSKKELNNIIINGNPIITNNLVSSQVIALGGPVVNLAINVSPNTGDGSQGTFSYQWYQSQIPINGANASSYSISPLSPNYMGDYYVLVSNGCGTIKSNVDHITMVNVPSITSQPLNQQVCLGKSVSLSVTSSSNDGTNSIYQWYFQSNLTAPQQSIIGATNSDYTINRFVLDSVGYYSVAIKNTIGTVNSNVVFIGDETAPQINNISSIPSISGGVCINSNLQISAQIQSKRNSAYTVTWFQNNVVLDQQNQLNLGLSNLQISNTGNYLIEVNNICGSASKIIPITVIDKPKFQSIISSQVKCIGSDASFNAALLNASNDLPLKFQWIKDGLIFTGSGDLTSNIITINNLQLSDSGKYSIQVSNACGVSVSNIATLSVVNSPVITQQPLSIVTCVKNPVSITIQANSIDNNLNYEWYKNDNIIPTEIGNQINFNSISATDVGIYYAKVNNGCNQITVSNKFEIMVNDIVGLKQGIVNKNLCAGSNAYFDLSQNLNYVDNRTTFQWELNGLNIPDPSAQTIGLQIPTIMNSNAGNYSLFASNSCGSNIFPLFNLSVTSKPAILSQPISGTVCEGSFFSNSISVSNVNNLPIAYQWNFDGNAVVGATGPQYNIQSAKTVDQGMYSVTLTNSCGVITSSVGNLIIRSKPLPEINVLTPLTQCLSGNSFIYKGSVSLADNTVPNITWDFGDGVFGNTAQLTHTYISASDFKVNLFAKSIFGCLDSATQIISVNTQPLVLIQPEDQKICSGGLANFSVSVKLKPNEQVGYQWYYKDQIIVGAINSKYNIPIANTNSEGNYKAIIQNACGLTNSNPVVLKIADKPLITEPLPNYDKICLNSSYTLKPIVYSILPNTYQWYKNNLPIVGQLEDSIHFSSFSANDNANYQVVISNSCGSITSTISNLIFKNIPLSNQVFRTDTICYLSNTTISHDILNLINYDETINYKWFKNGNLQPNYTNNSFTISKFAQSDTGIYTLKIANSCGSTNIPIIGLSLNKPKSDFNYDTVGACTGKLQISLKDAATSIFPIRNYYWRIVENNTTLMSLPNTSYQFNSPGKFNIHHAVIDSKGCASDTISYSFVNFGKPTARFFVSDTCLSSPSIAVDNSIVGFGSSRILSYKWNYGDTIITNNNPIPNLYTFKSAGKKDIQLIISSDSSCVLDTMTKTITVFGFPKSSFVAKDSCQGFPVMFVNKSVSAYAPDSIGAFLWKFGDNTLSTLKNPQHIFGDYGSFKVSLIAYSAHCPFLSNDTTFNLRIKPPRMDSIYPKINAVNLAAKQLHAVNGARSYSWNPITGLSDSQVADPFINLKNGKITYKVTIVDSSGCILNDQQEVWTFSQPNIYLANAFSPNGDGNNDFYQPQYVDISNLEYFKISDKNNRQLYITNQLNDKWDGKVNGNSVPSDAYIVSVSGIDIYGNRIFRQSVIVLLK